MKSLTFNSRDSITLKSGIYDGVNVAVNLVHTTDNTDFVDADLDISKIDLKVTLKRYGKAFVLIAANLRDLVAFMNFHNNLFIGATKCTSIERVTRAKGGSVKKTSTFPYVIPFGGNIVLTGDDELIVELNPQLSAINSTNVNDSTSKVIFSGRSSVGEELGTPYIKTETIITNQNNPSYKIGDNITKLALLNFDKTDYLDATAILSSLTCSSDKRVFTATREQLLADQFNQFDSVNDSPTRYQSYLLHAGVELDSVRLDLSLTSANVAANKNVVAWQEVYFDERILKVAAQQKAEEIAKFQSKL